MQNYLAIDLGAESGRGVLAAWDGEHIALREVRRFPTGRGEDDLGADGVRRWDFERLWDEVRTTLAQATSEAGTLAGVGVDSWGVDFGLLDDEGNLLEAPVHYRDTSHPTAMRQALSVIPAEEFWDETGLQLLPFNTLFQLLARQTRDPRLLENARHLLLIPDLLHHRLTGGAARSVERTNASTTQCLSPQAKTWDTDLMARLGLSSHYLGGIVDAGARLGATANGTPVYAPGTHDTASAVAAVPTEAAEGRWAYLSSGTWSLLGVERPTPVLSRTAFQAGLSNEGGVGGTTRLLQNIMGLWLVQECRRSLRREGREHSYAELAALAEAAPADGPLVDATDHRFLAPNDMIAEIGAACTQSGQTVPSDVGPLIRCCLDSLALAYRRTLRGLETLLGEPFEALHIVGGGSQNRLLNQLTADACGIPVIAGPSEATALGNALGQLVASGAVSNWAEARAVSRRSSPTEIFTPDPSQSIRWEERVGTLH